jgi:hypothetical protein
MTQICLLDPAKLSRLLNDTLTSNQSASSLMVSAANGSILSYAFRGDTPGIKDLRTMSTTMTAAYTVSSEDILVFEAQVTRALSVIIPVGDHILLAVSGPTRPPAKVGERVQGSDTVNEESKTDSTQEQEREDLEQVAEFLAGVLREELAGFKWPGDI